jgi:tetratricopeptide (TPR) repeat protein
MSNYVFGTSLRYQDYLQAKSFEDGLREEISSASRSIIASNEELARDHIAVLKSISSEMTSGFEQLSYDVRALSDGVAELNSTFQWGFSEVLTRLGGLNDSLNELIRIAKTPAQTWAYEQFEIARDAFRRELYDDGIQYLNRAISGHGDNTGYNLEYRFHYLLGTIRIGSFKNHSQEIVDPLRAEQAFLNAGKYARRDHPKEAARSYLGAGWAAYCQGNMQAAEGHTRDAMALDPSLAEAHFQFAKVQMHTGNPTAALGPLRSAIRLDRGYTVKACTDGDFGLYQEQVDSLLEDLRREVMEIAKSTLNRIESGIDHLEKRRSEEFTFADDAPIVAVRRIADAARSAANTGTYYGYLEALRVCDSASSAITSALKTLQQKHKQQVDQLEAERHRQEQADLAARIARSTKARSRANTAMWLSIAGILCLPVSIAGIVLGIVALTDFKQGHDQKGNGNAIAAIVIGALVMLIFCIVFLANLVETVSKGS